MLERIYELRRRLIEMEALLDALEAEVTKDANKRFSDPSGPGVDQSKPAPTR